LTRVRHLGTFETKESVTAQREKAQSQVEIYGKGHSTVAAI
jgi:hypothetical protein